MIVPFDRPAFGNPFGIPFGTPFGSPFGEEKGAFNPADFGDLRVDLDAFKGVDPTSLPLVDAWADQSGNGNNASKTSDARRPVFTLNGINGFPSLIFAVASMSELSITDKASIDLTASFAVYFVIKPLSFSGFPTLMGKGGNNFRFLINSSGGVVGAPRSIVGNEDDVGTVAMTINTPVVLEYHYNLGTEVKYTGSGASLGTQPVTITAITPDSNEMFIGQGGAEIQWNEGELGRMLLYASLPTTSQRNSIIKGLGDQFGISVVPIADEKSFLLITGGTDKILISNTTDKILITEN